MFVMLCYFISLDFVLRLMNLDSTHIDSSFLDNYGRIIRFLHNDMNFESLMKCYFGGTESYPDVPLVVRGTTYAYALRYRNSYIKIYKYSDDLNIVCKRMACESKM